MHAQVRCGWARPRGRIISTAAQLHSCTAWPGTAARLNRTGTLFSTSDRKIKTRVLGQPNPETEGEKNIFRAHLQTYSKTYFFASLSFWHRCQNDLQKYPLPLVSGLNCPRFWVWVFPSAGPLAIFLVRQTPRNIFRIPQNSRKYGLFGKYCPISGRILGI